MAQEPELHLNQLVVGMRSGLTDDELMEKHKLTPEELRNAFQVLLADHAISPSELYGWSVLFNTNLDLVETFRLLPRQSLKCTLAIYDQEHPEAPGVVFNISKNGVGIAAMDMNVGDTKTLVVPDRRSSDYPSFVFQATCRWVKKGKTIEDCVGGFEIAGFAQGSLRDLRNYIRELSSGECE